MGWFDDDDNDDDDDDNHEGDKGKTMPEDVHQNNIQDDNDGDDPLDAYMKTLEQQPSQSSLRSSNHSSQVERLDLENEDEATSHWHANEKPYQSNRDQDEDNLDNLDSDLCTQTRNARQALTCTFHKEGSNPNKNQLHPSNTNVSIQLEVVHHDQMQYNSFRKVFWDPKETPAGHSWRNENEVRCTPTSFDPITSFDPLTNLLGHVLHRIHSTGYSTPTPVQAQTLSVALAGCDALVTAPTGSGKTLAYVWPMAIHLSQQYTQSQRHAPGPKALVLVPTREIALQVHKHVKTMTQSSIAITGGVNRYQLVQDWKRNPTWVVVATPGRLLDVLRIHKNGLSLQSVTFVVLDECDRMLDMGFESQVKMILSQVRPDRQSLLFSATLGRKIELVAQQWLVDPTRIAVGQTGRASDHVRQHVMVLPNFEAKKSWLQQMLPILADIGQTLVFVATRADCDSLTNVMQQATLDESLTLAALHGDLHASDRHNALRAFAKGHVKVMIATDVAARGLDTNVATVICFDPAKNLDTHVHRVGRAGRLAKEQKDYREGSAYTLLTKKDADFAHVLMNSFERDHREISPELRLLAQTSRRSGNSSWATSRNKNNKAGLGFDSDKTDVGRYGPISHSTAANEYQNEGTGCDPMLTAFREDSGDYVAKKRSRWS